MGIAYSRVVYLFPILVGLAVASWRLVRGHALLVTKGNVCQLLDKMEGSGRRC